MKILFLELEELMEIHSYLKLLKKSMKPWFYKPQLEKQIKKQ